MVEKTRDLEADSDALSIDHKPSQAEATAQLIAVAILELGVIFHS